MVLEICIEDVAGLDAAVVGGADRVEIGAALSVGGVSPAPSLIAAAAAAPITAHMLVRPREGGFSYSSREVAMMAADIEAAAAAGLAGVVFGATLSDRTLDADLLAALVQRAKRPRASGPLSVTLHRAFDLCPDLAAALETAISLGFDQILTSGGAPTAPAGAAMLARLHRQAAERIVILAGSGVDVTTVDAVVAAGITDIHASCRTGVDPANDGTDWERRFGFASGPRRHANPTEIAALKSRLDTLRRTT